MSQVVLITGCSTGMGRDLAERLSQAGYDVAATARRVETLDDIRAGLKLPLDVTLPDSIAEAVECTLQRYGRIDVLVNNAGYALGGAIEEVSIDQVQKMFDVNVFGVMRMIQAVAPHMRRQRKGRIINLSSVAGRMVTPVLGAYAASKYAVEALSDALRLELAPYGIQVVLIEPGPIDTSFQDTLHAQSQRIFGDVASPYQPLYRQVAQFRARQVRAASGPEVVSRVIQQAIEAEGPKARYLAGASVPMRMTIHLGGSARDAVIRRLIGEVNTGQEKETA